MLTLRDGNNIIPLNKKETSIEIGGIQALVSALETVRLAVIAGELDKQLEKLINERQIPKSKKPKPAAGKGA